MFASRQKKKKTPWWWPLVNATHLCLNSKDSTYRFVPRSASSRKKGCDRISKVFKYPTGDDRPYYIFTHNLKTPYQITHCNPLSCHIGLHNFNIEYCYYSNHKKLKWNILGWYTLIKIRTGVGHTRTRASIGLKGCKMVFQVVSHQFRSWLWRD